MIHIKRKFAFLPIRTSNGKLIWLQRYVKKYRKIYGLAGEHPAIVDVMIFTPQEYTFYLLKEN